jgi:hypothetical protein
MKSNTGRSDGFWTRPVNLPFRPVGFGSSLFREPKRRPRDAHLAVREVEAKDCVLGDFEGNRLVRQRTVSLSTVNVDVDCNRYCDEDLSLLTLAPMFYHR